MKKATTVWLWIALVLCVCTTGLNLSQGRWLSVAIAVVSIGGLCALLFTRRKLGYWIMCLCALGSFGVGVSQNLAQLGAPLAVGMSLLGSALVPVVTGLFLKGDWGSLR